MNCRNGFLFLANFLSFEIWKVVYAPVIRQQVELEVGSLWLQDISSCMHINCRCVHVGPWMGRRLCFSIWYVSSALRGVFVVVLISLRSSLAHLKWPLTAPWRIWMLICRGRGWVRNRGLGLRMLRMSRLWSCMHGSCMIWALDDPGRGWAAVFPFVPIPVTVMTLQLFLISAFGCQMIWLSTEWAIFIGWECRGSAYALSSIRAIISPGIWLSLGA